MFCRCFIIVLSSESFRKETLLITKSRTPPNICLLVSVRSVFLRYVADDVVSPPNAAAEDPVYAVNKNVFSFHITEAALQNSKQKRWATFIAVLFPAPASSVTNMISCSRPPLAFKVLVALSMFSLLVVSSAPLSF